MEWMDTRTVRRACPTIPLRRQEEGWVTAVTTMSEPDPWADWPKRTDCIADLVRYVSAAAVAGLDLGVADAHARRAAAGADGRIDANGVTVARIYEKLHARRYEATSDVLALDARVQVVRHPRELDGYAGTCLDFSVLLSSACLHERVAPLLLAGWDRSGSGHACVVADLGRDPDDLAVSAADAVGAALGDAGVVRAGPAVRQTLGGHERYLPLDPMRASRACGATFRSARQAAVVWLGQVDELWVLDVVALQAAGRHPFGLVPVDRRPRIGRQLPASAAFIDYDDARVRALNELSAATGVVAVVGAPGVGKSLLALQAAARATGGAGWFVDASSVAALRESLGRAEATERYGSAEGLSGPQMDELAEAARQRLSTALTPWVVVADNADLSEDGQLSELLALLPTPRADAGQRIIVTSTDRRWLDHSDHNVVLEPVRDGILGMPASLAVGGRPLFAAAFGRLAELHDTTPRGLASLGAGHEQAGSAPRAAEELLWSTVLRLEGPSSPTVACARVAAWSRREVDRRTLAATEGGGAVDRLWLSGLVEPTGPFTAMMHRLVAGAIRAETIASDPTKAVEAMTAALHAAADVDSSSAATIEADLRALARSRLLDGDGEAVGRALHAVAGRVEPLAGAGRTDELYRLALPLLAAGDHRRRADCMHSAVRVAYQHHKRRPDLEAALVEVGSCLELRERGWVGASGPAADDGDRVAAEIERERTRALSGLVKIELGAALVRDAEPAVAARGWDLVRDGNAEVDASLRRREELLGQADDEDVLRGRYNQAMSAVVVAQLPGVPGGERTALLGRAAELYGQVGDRRRRMRPRAPRSHIAACDAGEALAAYLSEVPLDPRRRPGTTGRGLRTADRKLERARELREEIEATDGPEIAKTARLAAKIALARYIAASEQAGAELDEELTKLAGELASELPTLAEAWRWAR